MRKADIKGRLDLRDQLTVTIHSAQAEVIDDALTIAKDDDGNWKLGVHIADVAHYVPLHSPIDREALKRGMAVYLGNDMIPLVPPPLSTSLCSFNQGKDRLAISVMVTLNAEGEVLEFEIQPSVIAVDHALDYKQAQAILSRKSKEELKKLNFTSKDLKKLEPVFEVVDNLYSVSQAVRQQRMARGSFELNLPEHEFPDDAKEPLASYASPPLSIRR